MKEIKKSILKMNRDELNEVVSAVRTRRDILARTGVNDFSPGDKVQFTSRQGNIVECEVVKTNIKTVTCKKGFQEWRVPPSLLSHRDFS